MIFLIGIFSTNIYTQESEADLIKRANELFEADEFVEATPLFNRLLSNDQRNHEWNYKYGTCLLYNAKNKADAIKYLKYSVKGNAPDEALYYLGKAYHLNFQFNDAQKYYNRYKKSAGSKAVKKLDVDRQIQMCKNGQKLLSTMNELIVSSKKSIKREDFFRLYDLSNIGGTILVTKDYQSKADKKKGHTPVIHFDKNGIMIVYSSYGDGSDNLDLYMKRKLPDGTWSESLKIQGEVNTNFDEDFAYMHPDGKYLYFSSKGHNSMGGYDVFRAVYNESTNSFSQVENLDFAVSTPGDDIFYIVDKDNKNCYFASDRQSKDGKIHVYKARVDRIPAQMAVIKGQFQNKLNAGNKKCEITVQDFATGKDIGKFNTKSDGGYLLVLPKSGKYKYFVNADGSDLTHVAVVDIPYLKEFRPLKQGMELVSMDGHEQLVINNRFDELFDDPASIMAEIYKDKAKLVPNEGDFNLDSLDQLAADGEILEKLGFKGMSDLEIGELAKRSLEDAKIELENADKKENIAKKLAQDKLDEAKKAIADAKKLLADAKIETDPDKQLDLIQQAGEEFEKADILQKDADNALKYVAKADQTKDSLQQIVNEGEKFTKEFDDALKNEDDNAKNLAIQNNTNYLSNVAQDMNEDNSVDGNKGINEAQDKYKKLTKEINDAEIKVTAIENDIAELNQKLKTTKKKKDKVAIEQEIKDKEEERDEINNTKIPLLNKKLDIAKEEYEKEVSKLTTNKEIDDLLTDGNIPAENIDLDINKTDADINNLATDIDQFKIKFDNDSKEIRDDIVNNQTVTQRTGDYSNLDDDEIAEVIEPEYVKNIEKIRNSGKDPIEINNEIIGENENLITGIDNKVDDLNKKIEDDPNNEDVQKWKDDIASLTEVKNKKIEENNQLKDDIANNENNNNGNENNNNGNENNGNENNNNANENNDVIAVNSVNDINPDFNTKKSDIENDAALNDKEKAEKLNELNQSTLTDVNKKIDDTKKKLDSEEDPKNKTILTNSLANLEFIKKDLEDKIELNNGVIAENNNNGNENNNNANENNNNGNENNGNENNNNANENNNNGNENNGNENNNNANENNNVAINLSPISTVDDLDENYSDQIDNIGNSDLNELDKAKEQNKINNNLLNKVNEELDKTNEAIENAPDNQDLKTRKTQLENIKKDIQADINSNENIIKIEEDKNFDIADENVKNILNNNNQNGNPNDAVIALVNNVDDANNPKNKVENTNADNFKTEDSKNKYEDIKSDVKDLKDKKDENANLTNDLNGADEKQAKKIQKAINKNNKSIVKDENEILTKMGDINNGEIEARIKENNQLGKTVADNGVTNNTDILKNSERKIAEAIVLQNDAKDLRNKAAKTKDKEEKNKILNEALSKENKAIAILDNNKVALNVANKDAEMNKQFVNAVVITNVPENKNERESVKQKKLGNQYLQEANNLQADAQTLRDSSKTAKKKYREALVKQADALDQQAGKKFQTGNKIIENANNIEAVENEWLAAHNDSLQDRQLAPAIVNEISQKKEFKTFKENIDASKVKTKEADKIAAEIDAIQKSSKRKIVEAVVNYSIADTTTTDKKAGIEIKAKEAELQAQADLKKIQDLKKQEDALRNEAKDLKDNAYNAIAELDTTDANNIIAAASKDIKPVEAFDIADADFKTPTKLNGTNVFRMTNGDTPYNDANPVPKAGVTEGLVFKVQVGAFAKPIPQNTFKKFAPMSTETIRNNIKRYMVGYFATKAPAFEARDQIRALGYRDAFVVAYLHGKRITMGEANRLIESGTIPEYDGATDNNVIANNGNGNGNENNNNANENNNNANENNGNENNNNANENNNNANENNGNENNNNANENNNNANENNGNENNNNANENYNNAAGSANSKQVEQMQGLFYTVQIGVYNKPVSAGTLRNISPLNSQKTENNQIRYSTGVFKSVEDALSKRTEVRAKGINDAFVTAYYNGKRITVSEAKKLVAEQGEGILFSGGVIENGNNNNANENNNNGNENNNNDNGNNGNENNNNIVETNANPTPDGVYFRVDLGTYNTDVPQELAKFLFDNKYQIENETMIDGNVNFFTNKIIDYKEASELKQKMVDDGLARSRVRAYYKYDEITIGSAMKILAGEKVDIKPIHTDLDYPEEVIKENNDDNKVENDNEPKELSPADYNKEAIYFRLIMGVYDGEVPADQAHFFMESNIKYEEDELGKTKFYKGDYKSFEEVDQAQKDLQQKGFEGSEIKAYYKYEEISVDLAKIILEYK